MTFDDDGPHAGAGALPRVHGADGGSSKGGGGAASSAPDTLFSTATVRLVDLLGEGEIVGVRGGLKGVYLNDVPVQNADGSFNFKGLTAEFRVGTPDQPYMAGYPDVQTPNNVGIKVNAATPVTVSISDTDVDRLRVTIQVPSLFLAKSDGSVRANSVSYRIQARYSGGPWVNALGDQTITGKTTSGYFRSHEIALPINPSGASAPWQVQVVRLSPDTDDFNNSQAKFTNQSDLVFHSTTSIVDARFGYPHSAVVGLTAQAASFGSSVPGRTYLVDGVLMPIPSNYDPVARTYAGVWDGTFKEGFSNNPAWALNLILRNDRFGLGAFIDTAAIDKWSLYEIGRYCDVRVADGKGGQEPRYVFNGAISTQQEAFELLQLIAQVFRGTVYWSSGTVTAAQDRPADPVLLVTEANVVDGEFSYASSGRRARHTVAIVAWNDPDNLYKQTIEVVEDAEGVARYGYNPTKIDLLGCTSRGQAHRTGLWTLFTELHQTQVLAYKAGLDHAVIRPGDIVAVQDPQIANLDLSGRLLGGSTATVLKLDRPVTLTGSTGYAASVMLPDGTVQERAITTGSGATDTVTLASALSQVPDPAAVWLITGPVAPQFFRIVSIREEEPHIYAVSALQHEPGKYAAIDDGATFEPSVVSEFPAVVLPPTGLSVRESQYTELGQPKQAMTLSWTAGQPFNSVAYYVTVIRPSGATATTRTASQSIDFLEAEVGVWTFVVTAIGLNGRPSLPVQTTYTLAGWAGQAATSVTGLSVKGGGSTFSGRSCTVTWANQIAATVPPYPVRNAVYVFDASTQVLVHREVLPAGVTEWTYDYLLNANEGGPRRQFRVGVTAYSAAGDEGPPAYLTVSNPPPAGITPTLDATSEALQVSLPPVTDPDFAGYLVWVSDTPGINPLTAKPYEVSGSLFTFAGTADKTYYVRVAAFDAFGKNPADLNVSAEQSKKLTILLFDPSPPAIPGQPTVSANVAETAPDGTTTSKITIAWPAVSSSNLGQYEVFVAEGNNPPDSAYVGGRATTGTSLVTAALMPGRVYSFKVRTESKNGFAVSGMSPVLVVTAAANTVAPANPTDVSLTQSLDRVAITFTPPADKDLAYIEVWAAGGTFPQASPVGGTPLLGRIPYGSSFFFDPLAIGGVRTYWLRSVNTSGTPAASYVRAGAATSVALQAAQIAAGIVDETKFAASVAPPVVVQALPTTKGSQFVTLASDGKLYRWDAALGRYTAAVAASDISGKIVGTQITDGAITTPLLGANVVTAAKINATDIFADAGVFNSLKAGIASFGGLTADQISANAISANKIGVGIGIGNMLPYADCAYGNVGYNKGFTNVTGGGVFAGSVDNATVAAWSPKGMGGVGIWTNGAVTSDMTGQVMDITPLRPNADGTFGSLWPVIVGQTYEFSAYASTHRCRANAHIVWCDANGTAFSDQSGAYTAYNWQGQGPLSNFVRPFFIAMAPAGAAYALLLLRAALDQTPTNSGQQSFLFGSGFYFGQAIEGQKVPSAWAPGSTTVINGGVVATGSLNANKITAGTITSDQIQAGSIAVDRLNADQLRARIIDTDGLTASKIIVGGNRLSNWISAADNTRIEGGAIAANSITASRLTIGSRPIQIAGLDFKIERDGTGAFINRVSWSGGYLTWMNETGSPATVYIPGGYADTGGAEHQFWWEHGANYMSWVRGGVDNAIGPNKVPLAQYWGGNNLRVQRGAGIIIDGDRITALSIDANKIQANAIQAQHIAANQITGDKIVGGTITAAKIAGSTITGDKIAANTIAASNIQANSISARHISIGDTSNMLLNGDFGGWGPASTEGWSYIGGTIDTAGPDDPGGYHRLLGTQAECGQSVEIAGQAGDTIYISAMNWNASSYAAYLAILPLKANGDLIEFGILTGRPANNTGWLRMEGFYKLPAGTQKFKVRLYSDRAGSGDGSVVYWGKVQCRRATDASLVVNGSITAAKLSVGSLSAITANIGEVTAGKARSADGRFVIDFDAKYLAIWD